MMPVLESRLRETLDACLREGVFPGAWKEANLVLVPKPGKTGRCRFRPICVLGKAGKLLERIVAARITEHLETMGPDLNEGQFGFRRGLSTIDALRRVRKIAEAAANAGERTLVVGVDTTNAFNTLPWGVIHRALRYHRTPMYLRKMVVSSVVTYGATRAKARLDAK